MNDSLQSRVDSSKEKNDKTKAELRAARTAGVKHDNIIADSSERADSKANGSPPFEGCAGS
jgi:hypothetical protein